MATSNDVLHARSRVANASRWRPGSPELEDAQRQLREAKLAAYITKVLAAAPPLTADQRARLAELLKPVRKVGGAL